MKYPAIIRIDKYYNKTGSLFAINSHEKNKFPFKIKRIFFVNGKKNTLRGRHAHKYCSQLIICLMGKIKIRITDQYNKKYNFLLTDKKNIALFLPKKYWIELIYLGKKNMISVLCDHKYDKKNDYIEDLNVFLKKND